MEQRMCFMEHIDVMVGETLAMLEFRTKVYGEFRNLYTLKALFMSLVRPELYTSSCVWTPFYDVHVNRNGCSGSLLDLHCVI
jgi:hypothetical protein